MILRKNAKSVSENSKEIKGSVGNDKTAPAPFIVTLSVAEDGIDALNQCLASLKEDNALTLVVFTASGLKPEFLKKQLVTPDFFDASVLTAETSIAAQHIYIVPATTYCSLNNQKLKLTEQPDRSLSSLEVFLFSVAPIEKSRSIVLLFTPWITTYAEGLKRVRKENGLIMHVGFSAHGAAETETPLFTLLIDDSLPARAIAERVNSYTSSESAFSSGLSLQQEDIQSLEKVYQALHKATGIRCSDFDLIFILQHIQQRLRAQGKTSITAYADYINHNPREVWLLARRLSINVAGFYFERSTMQTIAQEIIPDLYEKKDSDVIRAWLPACSTGEEVLSLAMLLNEYGKNLPQPPKIQVIGTETDDRILEHAQRAIFLQNSMHAIPQELRNTYFDPQHDKFIFSRQLLHQVHFAHLDLNNTSPYSNLNLIYFRGHLNKLKKDVQLKVLKNLHASLAPTGYLVIGKDDHIGSEISLFTPIDGVGVVYKPVHKKTKAAQAPLSVSLFRKQNIPDASNVNEKSSATPIGQLHRDLLLETQSPVSILVKPDFSILDQHGNVGVFISWPNNGKTANLLNAFPKTVQNDLKNAIQQAIAQQKILKSKVISAEQEGILRAFLLQVRALNLPGYNEPIIQVMFVEPDEARKNPGLPLPFKGQPLNFIVNKLEADLRHSKDRLNTLTRQLDDAQASLSTPPPLPDTIQPKIIQKLKHQNGELKTTNKELLALNRDLVSRIEELRKRTHLTKHTPAPPLPEVLPSNIDSTISSLLSQQILKLSSNRHEIRTALTSIMGFADLLAERIVDSDNKELARYISKAGNRLSEGMSELLDGDFEEYEVFDKPKVKKEPVIDESSLSDRLLVVEDSDATRRLLSLVLSDRFECELAADASEAIEKAGKERFKAVLMDINLGAGQSGVDVLQHLRQKDLYQRVPFMAVTAMASPRDESLLRGKGFNAYLAKPFQKSKLLSTLDEMLADKLV